MKLPDAYILTKTHCEGYGVGSPVLTKRNLFSAGCRGGSNLEDRRGRATRAKYNAKYVKKAIHLIRDPFNNIVARFHLEYNRKNESFMKAYSNDANGFRSWCQDLDRRYQIWQQNPNNFPTVPCSSEFIRYTQWHNLALETAQSMSLPVHFVHYESKLRKFIRRDTLQHA